MPRKSYEKFIKIAQQELADAEAEKAAIHDAIIEIDEELAQNENSYMLRGGITKKEYNAMQTQISREEAEDGSEMPLMTLSPL